MANTTVITKATELIIGDGGGGCVDPVTGGIAREGFLIGDSGTQI